MHEPGIPMDDADYRPPEKPTTRELRDKSLEVAADGAIEAKARSIIDRATRDVCKYVNTVAGDAVIADPDNEVRRVIAGAIIEYERSKTDGAS